MLPNSRLIVADSTKCKQHSVSNFFPHAVSKYLCSFLWCAFSRVNTGMLSWLEGTLHALQRINIRTSMSRATRMLHTMATTAAVDSPVAEMESSRSHSCIADTETAFLRSAVSPRRHCFDLWPVKLSASKPYLLMLSPFCCHYYLSPRGPPIVWSCVNKCILLFTSLMFTDQGQTVSVLEKETSLMMD